MKRSQERAAQWPYDRVLDFWRQRFGDEEAKVQAYRERNAAICRAAKAGVTFAEIGRVFGMSGCNAKLVVAKVARREENRTPMGLEFFDTARAVAPLHLFESTDETANIADPPEAAHLRRRLRELQTEAREIRSKLRPAVVNVDAVTPEEDAKAEELRDEQRAQAIRDGAWLLDFTDIERQLIEQAHPSVGRINSANGAIVDHRGADIMSGRAIVRPSQAMAARRHGWSVLRGSYFVHHPDAWVLIERAPDAHVRAALVAAASQ